VLTLEDPYRFEKSRSVGAYLGLVPASDQSGDSDPQKRRISKEGDLRKLLVGSAHYILGPFGQDSDLRRHGEKIASRGGGKNAKKRAVVAGSEKALGALALSVANRRALRAALQRTSACRAGASGGLKRGRRDGAATSTHRERGGENYWHRAAATRP
jgi:transposase